MSRTSCGAAIWARKGGLNEALAHGRAGHGAGKPISKIIDETADEWAFVAYNLNMNVTLQ